jgi:hypothetical protein
MLLSTVDRQAEFDGNALTFCMLLPIADRRIT